MVADKVTRIDVKAAQERHGKRTPTPKPTPKKPSILVTTDMAAVVNATIAALQAAGVGVYQRAGKLVRVVRDGSGLKPKVIRRQPGAPAIVFAAPGWLRECAATCATWEKFDGRTNANRPTLPPDWVPKTILDRGEWSFPSLEGVIEAPTLRPDGTILDTPGYDMETGLLYMPGDAVFPKIQTHPTPEDARAALEVLLEPFEEFTFAAESDRATAVAAVLSVIARPAILGGVPMFPVDATTPGTGKSFLVDIVATIGTGRGVSRMEQVSDNDAEEGKRILSVLMEGDPVILIDDCSAPLGSGPLNAALTGASFKGRILGETRTGTVPQNAVWFATGNNLTYKGDLPRRVCPIRLTTEVEHPEEREFKRTDLLGWVRENRPRLVAAGLTMLRAYHCAGRPRQKLSEFGSFERWSDLIRHALVWAGMADPLATRKDVMIAADTDGMELGELLAAWVSVLGPDKTTSRALLGLACRDENIRLKDALRAIDPKFESATHNPQRIGTKLGRWQGRIVNGMRLRSARVNNGKDGSFWWVESSTGEPIPAPKATVPAREWV